MITIFRHGPTLLASLALLAVCPADGSEPAFDGTGLYRQLTAASVKVLVDGHLRGTGWLVADEEYPGLAVTAAHVVWPRDSWEVVTQSGERLNASVVAWDRAHDLVLMEVEGAEEHAGLTLGERMPAPGTRVFLAGMPQFRHDVMVTGHVARDAPSYEYTGSGSRATYLRVYHISAPAPHGTSGGAWVDEAGRVVGLQSGMMTGPGGSSSGIAFASDVSAVHQLVQTRQNADSPTLAMAVEELWEQRPDFIAQHREHGPAVVAKVVAEGGPAYEAGVRDHALILAVEGERMLYRDDFYNALRRRNVGEAVVLTIISDEHPEPHDVRVELSSSDAPPVPRD